MFHVMFDIDGTLVESYDFDSKCFVQAVTLVTGIDIDTNWARYRHVTDTGILNEFFVEHRINNTDAVSQQIKREFLHLIGAEIAGKPLKEISGASAFITTLKALNNVTVSFATGGWYKSAVMKLKSAGIDFSGIPIASSDDHYSRIEIMKLAERMTGNTSAESTLTYFGDGSWDLKACRELGANFVLVGDKLKHDQSIKNFESHKQEALAYIGLSQLI